MAATIGTATTVDEAVAAIQRDGVVVLPDLLTPDQLEALKADMLPLMDSVSMGKDDFFAGTKTRRAASLFARTRALDPVLENKLFRGTAEAILCTPTAFWFGQERVTETPTLQVGATQCIQIHPGQGLQPLHRDDALYHTTHPGPEDQIGVMIAISDFTEENGATRMIPQSHLWDAERMPLVSETIPAEMKAGSALMWGGGTYHGGGQNVSVDSVRTGCIVSFSRGYLRQEENQYLTVPLETVATLSKDVQGLLGYATSNPLCGWIEYDGEMSDPSVVLGDTENAGLRLGADQS